MSGAVETTPVARLIDALAGPGWCVLPGYFDAETVDALRAACLADLAAGEFHAAGVGRGQAQRIPEIRGDAVRWLETSHPDRAVQSALAHFDDLRRAFNRALFLGLDHAELHFAYYPPGAGYQRHLDRFRDDDRRVVTVILYLNPLDWRARDGGQLRFWPNAEGDANDRPLEIDPLGGTLVCFLSDRYWHEVTPAARPRLSLTGWMRRL